MAGGDFGDGFLGSVGSSLMSSPGFGNTFNTRHSRLFASVVVGGTASELGGGKFGNGALSAAFVEMFNHQSQSDESFTPADLDELKAKLGWQKGEALVFSGKRPLAGKSGVILDGGATDALNLEGLHEQVFMIDEAGALRDIGFFNGPGPKGGAFSGGTVRPDRTASFTDYTFSKKSISWRSIRVQSPDPTLRNLRLGQTRTNWNWTISQLKSQFNGKYDLIMFNCQDFSYVFRANSKNWK